MFNVNDAVQIVNHSEPNCNMQYGTITELVHAYDGTRYYTVQLDDTLGLCVCTDDEIMEG